MTAFNTLSKASLYNSSKRNPKEFILYVCVGTVWVSFDEHFFIHIDYLLIIHQNLTWNFILFLVRIAFIKQVPLILIKGIVQRDFSTLVFSLNGFSWFQKTCLKAISNFVKFSWSYLYLKYQNIDSLLSLTAGSKKFSLRQPIFLTLIKCSW